MFHIFLICNAGILLELIAEEIWRRLGEARLLPRSCLSKNRSVRSRSSFFLVSELPLLLSWSWAAAKQLRFSKAAVWGTLSTLLENCSLRAGSGARGQGKGAQRSPRKRSAQDHNLAMAKGEPGSSLCYFSRIIRKHWFGRSKWELPTPELPLHTQLFPQGDGREAPGSSALPWGIAGRAEQRPHPAPSAHTLLLGSGLRPAGRGSNPPLPPRWDQRLPAALRVPRGVCGPWAHRRHPASRTVPPHSSTPTPTGILAAPPGRGSLTSPLRSAHRRGPISAPSPGTPGPRCGGREGKGGGPGSAPRAGGGGAVRGRLWAPLRSAPLGLRPPPPRPFIPGLNLGCARAAASPPAPSGTRFLRSLQLA